MNVLIKSNGEVNSIAPINGTDFQLEELQAIVGGWIQIIELCDGYIMVVNEEGKSKGMPINSKATYLFQNHVHSCDFVVGDVLVCKCDKVK